MLLTGTYERSVDDKHRVAIPKRLRDQLGTALDRGLFIAPGTDGSLALYTEDVLTQLAARLAAVSPTGKDIRAFGRLFYAQAEWAEVDAQGRVRIPSQLAKAAGIGAEAVMLGVQDHLELWDAARWREYLQTIASQYDEIAERAFQTPEKHRG